MGLLIIGAAAAPMLLDDAEPLLDRLQNATLTEHRPADIEVLVFGEELEGSVMVDDVLWLPAHHQIIGRHGVLVPHAPERDLKTTAAAVEGGGADDGSADAGVPVGVRRGGEGGHEDGHGAACARLRAAENPGEELAGDRVAFSGTEIQEHGGVVGEAGGGEGPSAVVGTKVARRAGVVGEAEAVDGASGAVAAEEAREGRPSGQRAEEPRELGRQEQRGLTRGRRERRAPAAADEGHARPVGLAGDTADDTTQQDGGEALPPIQRRRHGSRGGRGLVAVVDGRAEAASKPLRGQGILSGVCLEGGAALASFYDRSLWVSGQAQIRCWSELMGLN